VTVRSFAAPLAASAVIAAALVTQSAGAVLAAPPVPPVATDAVGLVPIGTYDAGNFEAGAEIVAHHPATQQLYVTNSRDATVDIIDVADPTAPSLVSQIDLSGLGDAPNSVAVGNDVVAVAIHVDPVATPAVSPVDPQPGVVAFFEPDGTPLGSVEVGVLPDMVTFTPDGQTVVVANEAEPVCGVDLGGSENEDIANAVDPSGGVSLIDVSGGDFTALAATNLDFTSFDGAIDPEVRVYFPGSKPSQDLEPEYVAVSADGSTAYVTLQENNAVAVVDIATEAITAVVPLGHKDHSVAGNQLDPSDRDDDTVPGDPAIKIDSWPVHGMFMPDSIEAADIEGSTYLFTANEGDARDYDCYSEEVRIGALDFTGSPLDAALQDDDQLGRLLTTTATPTASPVTELFSYGARSFSVWDDAGQLVWDSGAELEAHVADAHPDYHNSQNNDPGEFDSRSDAKGPEPEALTIGNAFGSTYAFIGLERVGGVAVYDVSDPTAPVFTTYVNPGIDGSTGPGSDDISPEGMVFVDPGDSPTGTPLLVVANEVSSTTTIYELTGPANVELPPTRLIDTRAIEGPGLIDVPVGKLTPNEPLEVMMAGEGGLPLTGAAAFNLNVTATEGEAAGFLAVYPCADGYDGTSNVNYQAQTVTSRSSAAVLVTAVPDDEGMVCFLANQTVHLVVDTTGWLPTGQGFENSGPFRLFDTRDDSGEATVPVGKVEPNEVLEVSVAGTDGLPTDDIAAVVLNLVATEGEQPGFVSAFPCADGFQTTSNLNFFEQQSRANAAVVPVDDDGKICFLANQRVHLVADVVGYFAAGEGFQATGPTRMFDNRTGEGGVETDPVKAPNVLEFDPFAAELGLPEQGVTALSISVVATEGEVPGFLTVYPCADGDGGTSTLNFQADRSIANAIFVPVDDAGTICFVSNQNVQVVADLTGWFGPPVAPS